uniref:Uncharacterized protein n=1 Tax=Anopheles atroparvus TaxID=41427 RepID=A0A182J4S0_ANOAO
MQAGRNSHLRQHHSTTSCLARQKAPGRETYLNRKCSCACISSHHAPFALVTSRPGCILGRGGCTPLHFIASVVIIAVVLGDDDDDDDAADESATAMQGSGIQSSQNLPAPYAQPDLW